MRSYSVQSFTQIFASILAVSILMALVLPDQFSNLSRVEAGGKGKKKGGNIIISTSGGGGGGGSYSYPIPIPIPIHCDGGKSFWRRRRR